MDRNETIKKIRTALKRRSGKDWSVRGGHGTAWGWIKVSAPPRRMVGYRMSDEDRAELGRLLGFDRPADPQYESIPASSAYYAEYVDRAEGRVPAVCGTPHWD